MVVFHPASSHPSAWAGSLRRTTAGVMWLILVLAVAAPAQTPARRWKNYVKGPGVTAITNATAGPSVYTLLMNCPAAVQTEHNEITVPMAFSYSGSGTPTAISYQWSVNGATAGYCQGSVTPPPGSPQWYACNINLAAPPSPGDPPITYVIGIAVEFDGSGNVQTAQSYITVERTGEVVTECTFDLDWVKKTIGRHDPGTGFEDSWARVYADTPLPMLILDPTDKFQFRVGTVSGCTGIPSDHRTVNWELWRVGDAAPLVDASSSELDYAAPFEFPEATPPDTYSGYTIGTLDLSDLVHSIPEGQYYFYLYTDIIQRPYGKFRYSLQWSFQVEAPYLRFNETDRTYCFNDDSWRSISFEFDRHNVTDYNRPEPDYPQLRGHLYQDTTSQFTGEVDLAETSSNLQIYDRSTHIENSPYTAGSYFYRLKGRAEYADGTTAAVTSDNHVRVMYYPHPITVYIEGSACAVSGLPYKLVAGCHNWSSLNQVYLDESTDPSFATFTATSVYSQGNTVWRTQSVTQDTTYYYRTRVDNHCSDDIALDFKSGTRTVTVHAVDTIAPTVNFKSTQTLDYQSIRLTMTGADCGRLAEFHIYRDTNPGFVVGEDKRIALCAPAVGADTTYVDDGLLNGVTYYYRVVAVDTAGNASAPSGERSATTYADATPPVFPAGATVVLSYHQPTDEFSVIASNQVLLVRFPEAAEPDSAVACYRIGLKDETAGGAPDYRWTQGAAGRFVLPNANLVAGHTYRLCVTATNTSMAVTPVPITSATFQYVPGLVYTAESGDFTDPGPLDSSVLEKEYDPAYQSITHDAATDSVIIAPGSGLAGLKRKLRPAPKFTFEAVLRPLAAYDSDSWFEVRLEGLQGYYVLRFTYEANEICWHSFRKYVNGCLVASGATSAQIVQGQDYLFFVEHEFIDNGANPDISRLYVSAFGADFILDDSAGHAIDIYQVRLLAYQQNLAWDYFYHQGGSVDPVPLDDTPPSQPVVVVGEGKGYLEAWDPNTGLATPVIYYASTDPQSLLAQYQYAVGTTPGGSNTRPWTTGTITPPGGTINASFTAADGQTYYVSVRVKNDKGLWSSVGTSAGVLADKFAKQNDFFDAFDTDFHGRPYYGATSQVVEYRPVEKDVHVTYSDFRNPAFFSNRYAYASPSQTGSFRVLLNFHNAPLQPDNHVFEIYLGANLGENGYVGTTYYKIKLYGYYLFMEYYYAGVRKATQSIRLTVPKEQWGYLQFTFKSTGYKIQGLGLNQTWTKSSAFPVSVNSFCFKFTNINLDLDNLGLTKNAFGF